jgi:hypothetical protein
MLDQYRPIEEMLIRKPPTSSWRIAVATWGGLGAFCTLLAGLFGKDAAGIFFIVALLFIGAYLNVDGFKPKVDGLLERLHLV